MYMELTIREVAKMHNAVQIERIANPWGSVAEKPNCAVWNRQIRPVKVMANVAERFHAQRKGKQLPFPTFKNNDGGSYDLVYTDEGACLVPEPGLKLDHNVFVCEAMNHVFEIDELVIGEYMQVLLEVVRPAKVEYFGGRYEVVEKGVVKARPYPTHR
jgi:hypothetical protein